MHVLYFICIIFYASDAIIFLLHILCSKHLVLFDICIVSFELFRLHTSNYLLLSPWTGLHALLSITFVLSSSTMHSTNCILLFRFLFCYSFFIHCKSFHFQSMQIMLNIVCFASHHMYLIICILCLFIICISFYAPHSIYCIIYISFYMHFVLFRTFELLLKLVGNRPTDHPMDRHCHI